MSHGVNTTVDHVRRSSTTTRNSPSACRLQRATEKYTPLLTTNGSVLGVHDSYVIPQLHSKSRKVTQHADESNTKILQDTRTDRRDHRCSILVSPLSPLSVSATPPCIFSMRMPLTSQKTAPPFPRAFDREGRVQLLTEHPVV